MGTQPRLNDIFNNSKIFHITLMNTVEKNIIKNEGEIEELYKHGDVSVMVWNRTIRLNLFEEGTSLTDVWKYKEPSWI